jgi:hypothetical protein
MADSHQRPPVTYAIACATFGEALTVSAQFGDAEAAIVADHHRRRHHWRPVGSTVSAALAAIRVERHGPSRARD